ncbi:tRNA lysidine(34) synthetase TilS [Kaistia dalseonensis]|uniref:tRNA(Ile)-lysidine synthase n=1 Tax=Kaistia dalseonensis TaxID=410840 RepID=A0ABU0HA10_9HYPH|nr:tRNA lysidine(34) synthetase TilS [Kaistia dalseonensis]MCX5496536.1 tRNA lysidine(34) synthetase TilS [Kaistia dalseonensis]MDQ0439158.1 tRNA(Ile)-lysidine synthase [Kaistia dalseonensis]
MPAADTPLPIADAALDDIFAPLLGARRIALAVSGGADSLALTLLARRWQAIAPDRPGLIVLTVDHGLRAESGAEAEMVGEIAGRLGLPFKGLHWKGPYPDADLEAAARAARYALLVEAAHAEGADHLVTAHHRDDQAETVLMRLARGSGVYGLAGMAATVDRGGIRLARPLLGLDRATLAAIVKAAGLHPVDDPHNRDARFSRARLRALMPQLAAEGLDAQTLAATAGRLGRAAAAIDHYVGRLLGASARIDESGAVRLDEAAWRAEPEETRLRALARILRAVGGSAYVPRLERLAALELAMNETPDGRFARTLAGVLVDRRKGAFRFQRESGRDGLPEIRVVDRFDGVWDGRFRISLRVGQGSEVVIGALGPAGRRTLAVCVPEGQPRAIEALPAIRRAGRIIAVPGLGIMPDAEADISVQIDNLVRMRLEDPARYDDL